MKTYAYTDVRDPWQEMFETAYGRLVVTAEDPGAPPMPVVDDPMTGIDVTEDQITAYSEYVAAKATYDLALANYYRDLAEIAQGDFTGHPVAGGPSNTPEAMHVVAEPPAPDAEIDLEDTVAQFRSLSIIDARHLPVPPSRAEMSAIFVELPTPVEAQYRSVGHEDGPSMLSGSFDEVRGVFTCETTAEDDVCTIGAVTTDKGVEYNFNDATDTWKFIADDRAALVKTKRQDGDYLVMGWWLETASVSTGDFKFGRFFAGSDPYGDTDSVVVPGDDVDSAKYTGSAVGKYAERDAGTDTARKGLFRATATLVATFEDAEADEDMIEGTIDGFVDDSGAPRTWHVVLGESAIAAGAFGATTSGEAQGQDWQR